MNMNMNFLVTVACVVSLYISILWLKIQIKQYTFLTLIGNQTFFGTKITTLKNISNQLYIILMQTANTYVNFHAVY